MFAVLINNIITDAGRKPAFRTQAFFMSAHIVRTLYRYPCTPVHRLNGHAASVIGCDKRRDRHGYLLFLLCYNHKTFPTLHRLAATERQPTKRAQPPFALPAIPTPTLPAWGWTCTTATSATVTNPMHREPPSPARSTLAAQATPWEPLLTPNSFAACMPSGWRSRPGTATSAPKSACATRWPSSAAIPMPWCCPPGCRKPIINPLIQNQS